MNDAPESPPPLPSPLRRLGRRLLPVAVGVVIVCGVVAWRWPREDSVVFEGHAPIVASARAAIDLRTPLVLDQHGEPLEEQPLIHIALAPTKDAVLEGGKLLPLHNGTVRVVGTTDRGTVGEYSITLDLPADYAGAWVSSGRQGDVSVTTFVRARRTAGDAYNVVSEVVFVRGQGAAREVRLFGLKNRATVTGDRLCEDNPVLVPPDAPLPATTQCSKVLEHDDAHILLDATEGGQFTLRRPTPEDAALLHSTVRADMARLRDAEEAWRASFGTYLSAGSEAAAGKVAAQGMQRWTPDSNLVLMHWEPTYGVVHAGYWVTLEGSGYVAHAVVDADGDGVLAEYRMRTDGKVERVTPEAVL